MTLLTNEDKILSIPVGTNIFNEFMLAVLPVLVTISR